MTPSDIPFSEIDIQDIDLDFIRKVTLTEVYEYMNFLTEVRGNKAAARSRKVSSLRTYFKYLTNKVNKLEKNPIEELETPKQKKSLPKYLTLEQCLELLADVNGPYAERDYCILTLFLNCGMRLSELVGINISDINFKDEKLNVIGKGNKERTIYLNKACINAINSYMNVRPRDCVKANSRDALFLSERRERISNRTVQYIVKQELRRAGLDTNKYSVHKLRHTAATLMYKYRKC